MANNAEDVTALLAIARCGCVRAAIVDCEDTKDELADFGAKAVGRGYEVRRFSLEEARLAPWAQEDCPDHGGKP